MVSMVLEGRDSFTRSGPCGGSTWRFPFYVVGVGFMSCESLSPLNISFRLTDPLLGSQNNAILSDK